MAFRARIMATPALHPAFAPPDGAGIPVTFVTAASWPEVRGQLEPRAQAFADTAGFEPRPGRHLLLPGPDGALAGVLFAIENTADSNADPFRAGALPTLLPARTYRFAEAPPDPRLADTRLADTRLADTRLADTRLADTRLA